MKPTRVLLVDDQSLSRGGIHSLLGRLANVTHVDEASDEFEALRQIATVHPDIVLLHIALPGLNGIETLKRIEQEFPSVRTIILTMQADEKLILSALRSGASGFLIMNSKLAELELAIESVAEGQTYFCPEVALQVANYLQRNGAKADAPEKLTARQREVLQLVAEGCSSRTIAEMLKLSVRTVEVHRSRLRRLLDIHSPGGLVRYGIQAGIVATNH